MTDVLNPVDGSVVGQVEHHSESHVRAAIDRARTAFPAWSRLLAKQRSDILRMMTMRKASIALAAGRTIIMKLVAETSQTVCENSSSSDASACSRPPDLQRKPALGEVDY